MNAQIRRKFEQSYPLLTHQSDDNSYTRFGLEIGAGWLPLVYELFGLLHDLQKYSGQAVNISQVKEKFGSLRIYMSGSDQINEDIDLLESVFEALSMRICDICGAPGTPANDDGYLCTRCPRHRNTEPHETLKAAFGEASEQFIRYQRQGVDTSNILYFHATRGSQDELGCLKTMAFPRRLLSLEGGLMHQLITEQYIDRPISQLFNILRLANESGKRLIGATDGSPEADRILGRLSDD